MVVFFVDEFTVNLCVTSSTLEIVSEHYRNPPFEITAANCHSNPNLIIVRIVNDIIKARLKPWDINVSDLC
jgi:hypothetical protein